MGKIWHDSNNEQPESESTVVVWNPSIMDGEVLSRCVEVYPNRLWAYMSDLLALDPSVTNISDQEDLLDNDLERASKVNAALMVLNGMAPDATVKQLREVAVKCFKCGSRWQKMKDFAENEAVRKMCEEFDKQYDDGFETGQKLLREQLMKMPWIKPEAQVPNDLELVFIAMFDVKRESFQYYVGWYNSNMQRWYLNDCGYELSVSFWMPIPLISVNDL